MHVQRVAGATARVTDSHYHAAQKAGSRHLLFNYMDIGADHLSVSLDSADNMSTREAAAALHAQPAQI